MKYLVFEAGGRAGFSAEMFFVNRVSRDDGNSLVLADRNPVYSRCPCPAGVSRVDEDEALSLCVRNASDCRVFPADELARQGKAPVFELASHDPVAAVEKWYFDKRKMNETMASVADGCVVRVPETFLLDDVFVRPNTMSAGSHGVFRLENICITKHIEVAREYVVDILWTGTDPAIRAREVRIKNGYDKYLKFLGASHPVTIAAEEFIRKVRSSIPGMMTGVCHIQLIENPSGELFFVEYSKRISGTSVVNLYRGFNPFDALTGVQTPVHKGGFSREDVWYRYDDLIWNLYRVCL